MKKLAVLIKTFHRDDLMKRCVESVLKYLPDAKIYLGDDGFLTPSKEEYYKKLNRLGHCVIMMEHNIGISKGRNIVLDHIKEPFILLIDDDFVITEDVNADRVIKTLKNNRDLGLIGGVLNNYPIGIGAVPHELRYSFDLKIENRTIYKMRCSTEFARDEVSYSYCDLNVNFFIAKREIFKDVRWADELVIGTEHMDFFLQLKYKSDWRVARTNQMKSEHRPDGDTTYSFFRKRDKHFGTFADRWDIDTIHDVNGRGFNYRTLQEFTI